MHTLNKDIDVESGLTKQIEYQLFLTPDCKKWLPEIVNQYAQQEHSEQIDKPFQQMEFVENHL